MNFFSLLEQIAPCLEGNFTENSLRRINPLQTARRATLRLFFAARWVSLLGDSDEKKAVLLKIIIAKQ
jgi:hypothetical protein